MPVDVLTDTSMSFHDSCWFFEYIVIWFDGLNSWYVVCFGRLSFVVKYFKMFLFLLICKEGSPEMHRMLSIGLVRKAPIVSRIA